MRNDFSTIIVEDGTDADEAIITITMNRPEKKNAANGVMWEELRETFRQIAILNNHRVVILTGAGGSFCSGADLWGEGPTDGRNPHWLSAMDNISDLALALHRLPMPVIAKVRGVAAGAGMNMALGCDLIVASDNARFSEIFARRGLSVDFGGSWVLPRLIGMHKAKELALFADILDAHEAKEFGLVNRVVADDQLDDFVANWARRLAAGPPIALAQTKRLLTNSFSMTMAEALDSEAAAQTINFTTKDTEEAIRSFTEKREPKFTGR